MIVCGIDPGVNGGISFYDPERQNLSSFVMPSIGKDLDMIAIDKLIEDLDPSHIFVEHSQAIPGVGSSSSAFTFGKNFGIIVGIVSTFSTPYTLVKPRVWQKIAFEGTSPDERPKVRAAQAAARIFPGYDFKASKRAKNPHDGCIDSSLIAYYGARVL